MKKLFYSLFLSALTLMAACTTTEVEVADSISVPYWEMAAPAEGTTVTIEVVATNQLWAVVSDAEWCVAEKGEGTVTLTIAENTADERVAVVTLTCGEAMTSIAVNQAAVVEDLKVSTFEVKTPAAASTVTVGVTATDVWEAVSNADWCVVEKAESALTLRIAENTAEERTATITLTCGESKTSISVIQEDGTVVVEDAIAVADIDLNMPSSEGSLKLNVTATGQWTITNDAKWLTASQNEEGVLVLSFEANEGAERTATVILTCGEAQTVIAITQQEGIRVGVNPSSLSFAPEGGTLEIGVTANVSWKATTKDTSWLTVTTKNDIVTVKAKVNNTEFERVGKVSITYTDAATNAPTSIDVEVVQSASSVDFSTEDIVLNSDQTTATVTFNASGAWTASLGYTGGLWLLDPSWATLSKTEGQAGEQTLTVTFNGKDYNTRTMSVVVTCGPISKAITVTQKGIPAPQTGRKLRLMTLNQKVKGNKAIAKMVTDLDIDYVAVQEIDMFNDRNNVNQIDSLKKYTGYEGYFCKTYDFGGGEYGLGILSKKAALSTTSLDLPHAGSEPRKLFIAEYDDFVLATTHYTITSDQNAMCRYHLESANITLEALSKYPDKPVVLGGDFNTETDKDRAQTFGVITQLMDVLTDPTVCTYPNVNSDLLIDFLLFKRDAKFPYRKVDGGVLNQTETDHRPVWVELELFF